MPRVMMVARNVVERDALLKFFPNALTIGNDGGREALDKFRDASNDSFNCILICTKSFARTGFNVPDDTIILVGDGIDNNDYLQIMAHNRGYGTVVKSFTPRKKKDKYKPWEYVVRNFDNNYGDAALTSFLDKEGAQEWELVSFDFTSNRGIFKRHKKNSGEE